MTVAPTSGLGGSGPSRKRGSFDLNSTVGAIIAIAVVGLFIIVVVSSMYAVTSPPASARPNQGFEAFDPFARMLQIAGLVTPVLTTIVGFYFGVRAGATGKEAAESRASAAESKREVTQHALTTLDERLAMVPAASPIVDRVKLENPSAFSLDQWAKNLK